MPDLTLTLSTEPLIEIDIVGPGAAIAIAAAAASALEAQAWSEGTEPGGPGTKSAKGWSDDALAAAAATLVASTVGGGANAIQINEVAIGSMPGSYVNGMVVEFTAGSTNSNATVLKIGLLANQNVYLNGSPLTGGEIVAGERIRVAYVTDHWEMLGVSGRAYLLQTSTGSGNAYAFSSVKGGKPPALSAGMRFAFQAPNTNTGAATLNVAGLGAVAIVDYAGIALTSGQILSNTMVEVVYNGTNFRMTTRHHAIQQLLARQSFTLTTGAGTASAYVAASGTAFTTYNADQRLLFTPNVDNAASPTITINSVSTIPIVDAAGKALKARAMKGGQSYLGLVSGGSFRLVDLVQENPPSVTYPASAKIATPVVTTADRHGSHGSGQSLRAGYQRPDLWGSQVLTDGTAGAYDYDAPYDALTFDGGPRDQAPTSLVAHIETDQYDYGGGGTLTYYGESPSAGAAFEFMRQASKRAGVNYVTHQWQIVSTNNARGASSIRGHLKPSDTGYVALSNGDVPSTVFTAQIQAAFDLCAADGGKVYDLTDVDWGQGEGDALDLIAAVYGGYLSTVFANMAADARAITGQSFDPKFFVYQTYAGSRVNNGTITRGEGVAAAQLAADDGDSVFFVTALYPFALKYGYGGRVMHSDGHLTPIGSRLFGAYLGRSKERVLIEGIEPPRVKPLSATISGRTVTVNFSVPVAPLVFDTDERGNLPQYQVKDYGFAVEDGTGQLILSNIGIGADGVSVTMEVHRDLGSTPFVYYAHHYLPKLPGEEPDDYVDGDPSALIDYSDSAAGNLRDSDPETVLIAGNVYAMHNWSPHFKLAIT